MGVPPFFKSASGSHRMSVLLAWVFLCLVSPLAAQGPDTPLPTDIDDLVQQLRRSIDVSHAALRADDLRNAGKDGRRGLMLLINDQHLPPHVLQGIVNAFVLRNDRSNDVMKALSRAFSGSEGTRKQILRDALLEFDKQGSLLKELLQQIQDETNGARLELLDVAVGLVDDPSESQEVTDYLIGLLERGAADEFRKAIEDHLAALTYQKDLTSPAAWRAWFIDYTSRHPEAGFSGPLLNAESNRNVLRALEAKFVVEKLKAARRLARGAIIPADYLDPSETPEPEVRAAAADLTATVIAGDPKRQAEGVGLLLRSLTEDPDPAVRREALKALGRGQAIGALPEALQAEVEKAVLPLFVAAQELALVNAALAALDKVESEQVAKAIGDTYLRLAGDPEGGPTRVALVSALYRRGQDGIIKIALGDRDAQVQITAANSLGLLVLKPEYGKALAEALDKTEDAGVQASFLGTLGKLAVFGTPKVIDVLKRFAADDQPAREVAFEGLLRAVASPDLDATARGDLEQMLIETWPGGFTEAARASLASTLQQIKNSRTAAVTAAWCETALTTEMRKRLAAILVQSAAAPGLLKATSTRLLQAGYAPSAELLARELVVRATAADALPGVAAQLAAGQRLLARALLAQGGPERLAVAGTLVAGLLAANKDDLVALRVRADIREQAGKLKEAAADLARVLELAGAALAPKEIEDLTARIADLHLRASDPAKARGALERLPRDSWTRRHVVLSARADLALREHRKAYDQAISVSSPDDDAEVLRLIAETGFSLRDPAARQRAAAAVALLAKLQPEADLADLRERARQDDRLRALVAALDAATSETEAEALAKVQAAGAASATWLMADLEALADDHPAHLPVFARRLRALKGLLPDAPPLKDASLPTPATTRDQALALARALAGWFRSGA